MININSSAHSFRISLMNTNSVMVEFKCNNKKETEELYEAINKQCKEGELTIKLKVDK